MPDEEQGSSLFFYIKKGNIEELDKAVKRGTSINEPDKSRDSFTPLHCAAYYGSLECLHWLLWKGADTTLVSPKGWTPTHIAAIRGQHACVQALIQSGVNVNVRDHRGQTPAHLAATHGHSHTLQAILRSGADISIQDASGWTPVHTAAYHGRLGCLQFLKTAGGKLDECDNEGNTPLHLAAMEGHLPCVKYLFSNIRGTGNVLNARNDQGDTPKTLAEQFFKTSVVEYLDAVEWEREHPEQAENLAFPAHVAAFNGDLSHLKLLIEQGVININERDEKGCTPAHKAAGQGHIHILQWIIENGGNVNIKNNAGETPRDIAQRFAQLACCKLLEAHTGDDDEAPYAKPDDDDLRSTDSVHQTPEQRKQAKYRARKKYEEILKLLELAKSNFLQFGGKLEEINDHQTVKQNATMRTISELEGDLELERLRREKLEAQLDQCRQEMERTVKQLRDYENKVIIMERYFQQIRTEPKQTASHGTKKKKATAKKVVREEKLLDSSLRRTRSSQSLQTQNSIASDERRYRTSIVRRKIDISHLNLSNSEQKELKEAFDDVDKDLSGYISVKEIKQLFQKLNYKIDDDEVDDIMKKFDLNHDQRIDFGEFAEIGAKKLFNKYTKKELKEKFEKIDRNDSGMISFEELRAALSKHGSLVPEEKVEQLMSSVDKDNNGMLSFEEFARLLNK